MDTLTDLQLIELASAGDDAALNALMRRYMKPLYNFVLRIVGDKREAEDITQDALYKMWRSLSKYNPHHTFKAWLYRIAHNTAIDYVRARARHTPFAALPEEYEEQIAIRGADALDDPLAALSSKEYAQEMQSAVMKLPLIYRSTLALYYGEQLNFREISEALGESINTVKSRHRRALRLLRALIVKSRKE